MTVIWVQPSSTLAIIAGVHRKHRLDRNGRCAACDAPGCRAARNAAKYLRGTGINLFLFDALSSPSPEELVSTVPPSPAPVARLPTARRPPA